MTQIQSDVFLFESEPEQQELLGLTVAYLRKNPPTLGHGFSHFIKVARLGYSIAWQNDSSLAQIAWVSGLLHDIYRPAEGKAGQEDHELQTAKIAKELLSGSSYQAQAKQIVESLREHDKVILEGKANLLAKIISIADKTEMSFQRLIAYTWASNKTLSPTNQIPYTSFKETMKDFSAYQVKAWKLFSVIDIFGVDKAIFAYLDTNENLINAVRAETKGTINYQKEYLRLAKKEALLEKRTMEEFKLSFEEILDIGNSFQELWSQG